MQRMDRLRRSLRESFRRKKEGPESSKPHQWQADEDAVRAGNCTFHVKYLGCVEVYESRGMQVCEEAMKVLRGSRRRPVKCNLYVTGDGLRVVEDETKGLIVDQTIEKVSFCAPDRNHERGFSYICRDGTTRRWMCHGFLVIKDSGERLSHAVGCAFAVCLERKQKREKDCGVTMSYDSKSAGFIRTGSLRVTSMTDSLSSKALSSPTESLPSSIHATNNSNNSNNFTASTRASLPPTSAIERPHAPPKLLERQGSFRGFSQLSNQSPFKRQLSLRLNELPSNLKRTQQNAINLFANNNSANNSALDNNGLSLGQPAPPPRVQRGRLQSLPPGPFQGATIPEVSSSNASSSDLTFGGSCKVENKDLVSALCQEVTQGLSSLLAAHHDDSIEKRMGPSNHHNFDPKLAKTNPWDDDIGSGITHNSTLPIFNTSALTTANSMIHQTSSVPVVPHHQHHPYKSNNPMMVDRDSGKPLDSWSNNLNLTQSHDKAHLQSKISPIRENVPVSNSRLPVGAAPPLPPIMMMKKNVDENPQSPVPMAATGNVPPGTANTTTNNYRLGHHTRGPPPRSQSLGSDPFDADWAASLARTGQAPTNPFRQQTFQISM